MMSRSGSWYVLRFKDLFLVGLLPKRGIGHRRPSRMGRAGAAGGNGGSRGSRESKLQKDSGSGEDVIPHGCRAARRSA